MKCDFCSDPNPTWRYPCADFVATEVSVSEGAWAACDECASLIERDDREGLIKRCMALFPAEIPREFLRQALEELHQRFFDNRQGPTTRIWKQ